MGFFDGADDSLDVAKQALNRNRLMYDQIALPEYQEFNPELYNSESYNAELIAEDPMLKSKQQGSLKMLEQLANQGLSAEDEAGFAQARDMGAQQARSGTQAAIANAEARGVAGGGMEFAMREMANQGGAQRSQAAGLEQAAAAARQRALAAQAYQSALGQQRDGDYRANSANTNIVNQFNQANTNQRNAVGQANTDARNGAFQYNQNLKDKNYGNQIGRADRIAGFNDREGELDAAEKEAARKRRAAIGSAIGGAAGAMVGGPAGAAAGSGVGGAIA